MSRYRTLLLFVGLGAIWGGSFPAIEVGLRYFPPVLFAAVRYDFAGVLLLGYAVVAADRWRPTERADIIALLASGTFLIASNSLLFVGQQFTTGGVASIIYSLIPILTTGVAWTLLPDERPTAVGLVGITLGLAGAIVIARPDPSNLLSPNVVGIGFVFLATVGVAIGSVLVRRAESSLPDSTFTAWSMLIGAAMIHAFSYAIGESAPGIELPAAAVLSLAYIAVFATAMAFLIYFYLLGAYGPLETNLVSYLVPVVATLLGWAFLDERVTVWTVLGFVLIITGFVLLKRTALRSEFRRLVSARSRSR
ncbi:MAG: DMT family transporter [Halobacteriota archaeon]